MDRWVGGLVAGWMGGLVGQGSIWKKTYMFPSGTSEA